MEELIFMSGLPLNQLWQRTESLRENCHWITVGRDELELVGDSRRFVLPDDVADFVHPILSRNLNFQMAIHALLLFKVPLLPTRDYALEVGIVGSFSVFHYKMIALRFIFYTLLDVIPETISMGSRNFGSITSFRVSCSR